AAGPREPSGTHRVSTTSGGSGSTTSAAPGAQLRRSRRQTPVATVASRKVAMASSTIVAPGAVSKTPAAPTPAPATTSPMPIARYWVARNPPASSCAVATGTTISALTSNRPTARIATVTVTAVVTASTRLTVRTGKPLTRAYSSSWQAANSQGRKP